MLTCIVYVPEADFLFASFFFFPFSFSGWLGDGCHCVAGQELTVLPTLRRTDLFFFLKIYLLYVSTL
jgi:hypothetical protein